MDNVWGNFGGSNIVDKFQQMGVTSREEQQKWIARFFWERLDEAKERLNNPQFEAQNIEKRKAAVSITGNR